MDYIKKVILFFLIKGENEKNEEEMTEEEISTRNENFLTYNNGIPAEFEIKENGKYYVRYFQRSFMYLHKGKTIHFEVNEKDVFEIENNVLKISINSFDPLENGSWIGIYKSEKESTCFKKQNNEYNVFYYIPSHNHNFDFKSLLGVGE